jgi:tetratricopeptide (TPR) repeat protein
MRRRHALLVMGIAVIGGNADAAVRIFRPASASQVVLRLGTVAASEVSPELEQMKHAAMANSDLLPAYVEALLNAGATSGNERYYFEAEQAMQEAPAGLQSTFAVPRAKILQHRHDFRAAEQVLEPVLRLNSRDTRARLLRAQIRVHLRDSQGAMQDCVALTPLADILTSSICLAQARALRGDLKQSYALVTTALQAQQGTLDIRSWGAGVAAELAAQLGDAQNAEYWYRTAFELDPSTHFPRVAYAGWLRSRGNLTAALAIEGASR